MSEHDDIEKKLKEYREGRDQSLPADRRLLPVHKDQLLAEARRRYGPGAGRDWFAWLRPGVRWAVIATPLLILGVAGYLWIRGEAGQSLRRDALVAKKSELRQLRAGEAGTSQPVPASPEPVVAGDEIAAFPAESKELDKSSAVVSESASALPEAEKMASPRLAAKAVLADGPPARNELAQAQIAQLDLSGVYRQRSESKTTYQYSAGSRDDVGTKDQKNEERAMLAKKARPDAAGKPVSNFANFKLVQSAESITLVDADGSTYSGRLEQPQTVGGLLQEKTKSKAPQKQDLANIIQQVSLVGTNQMTREVVNLIVSFYVEPPAEGVFNSYAPSSADREENAIANQREPPPSNTAPAQSQIRIAGRLNVFIEKIDPANQRQERIADAERLGER
jgi:hypothetical protein